MFQILTLAVVLFASQQEPIEEVSAGVSLEKIEEIQEFSEERMIMAISDQNESPEFAGEINEQEIAQILDVVKLETEAQASLEGMIEKEMGAILTAQKVEEEKINEIAPVYEGLVEIVEQPATTMAEPPEKTNDYQTLTITWEEKQKIGNILTTLAENSIFKLLFEKKRLERLGHEINHVHPMRFLGTVFSDPRLVHCMFRIRESGFKWDGFIDGFSERFMSEVRVNNINRHVSGLAESLNVNEEELRVYVDKNDFEGMVLFLMRQSRKKS